MKGIHKVLLFTVVWLGLSGLAMAEVLNFDDLPEAEVPSGYGGLDWYNFNVTDPDYIPGGSGYLNGRTSPANVVYNRNAGTASISSATAFSLGGGYFAGAWNDGLTVEITGFNGAVQQYSHTVEVNTDGPTLVKLNWTDLTRVTFASYGGVAAGFPEGSGEHFSLDDLVINALIGITFGTGRTANQRAILAVLQTEAETASGAFYDDLDSLALLPEGAFLSAVDQLSPEVYAGLRNVGRRLSQAAADAVFDRLGALRLRRAEGLNGKLLYASAGEVMRDTGPAPLPGARQPQRFSAWARPYYLSADQERTNSFFGYDYDARGLTVGADMKVAEGAYLGFLLGTADGDLRYEQVGAKTEIDSYYGGLYGSYQAGQLLWHGQLAWMRHEYDTAREIAFTAPARVAKSDHSADEYSLTVGIDYLGLRPGGWNLIPTASLRAAYYDEDSFSESGADGFNLSGKAFDQEYLSTRLGLRVNRVIEIAKAMLVPEVSLQWAHEFGDTDREVKARYEGVPDQLLVVEGLEPDRDSLLVGVGLASMLGDATSLLLKYNGEYGKDLSSWDASLTLRRAF